MCINTVQSFLIELGKIEKREKRYLINKERIESDRKK